MRRTDPHPCISQAKRHGVSPSRGPSVNRDGCPVCLSSGGKRRQGGPERAHASWARVQSGMSVGSTGYLEGLGCSANARNRAKRPDNADNPPATVASPRVTIGNRSARSCRRKTERAIAVRQHPDPSLSGLCAVGCPRQAAVPRREDIVGPLQPTRTGLFMPCPAPFGPRSEAPQ